MMNNEEFDRKMEFIVNQQAQFNVDIQKLQEVQKKTEEKLDRVVDGLAETTELGRQNEKTVAEVITLTREGFKLTVERFDAIAEIIAENSRNTDAKINALVDAQLRTEDKLDRHLNEDHNGDRT